MMKRERRKLRRSRLAVLQCRKRKNIKVLLDFFKKSSKTFIFLYLRYCHGTKRVRCNSSATHPETHFAKIQFVGNRTVMVVPLPTVLSSSIVAL